MPQTLHIIVFDKMLSNHQFMKKYLLSNLFTQSMPEDTVSGQIVAL